MNIPGLDHARLRMDVYNLIRSLEYKLIEQQHGSPISTLAKMVQNKNYGLVIDGTDDSFSTEVS